MPPPAPRRSPRTARDARTFYRLATMVLVVVVLYFAQVILLPLALAVLFAFALTPLAERLEKLGLPRVPSALLVTVLALGVIGAFGTVAGRQGEKFAEDYKKYQGTVQDKFKPVLEFFRRLGELEAKFTAGPGGNEEGAPTAPPPAAPTASEDKTSGSKTLSGLLSWIPTIGQWGGVVAANALLVTVLTIFLLVQRDSVRDRLIGLAGRGGAASTTRALDDAGRRVSRFLLLQASTNAAMGLIVGVGLSLLEVPLAPLWGMVTAGLRFLPYVGIWLSSLFPIVVALAALPGWWPALAVLLIYGVSDLIMTNAVEPLLFGHGTGVSSLALLISAVFWAWLWGPMGLLLSVPMTVCLVVIGEHVPSLSFLQTLLGDAPDVDPAARFVHRVIGGEADAAAVLTEEVMADRSLVDVYDEMLLPALAQAKAGRDTGDLSPAEERAVYRTAGQLLNGTLSDRRDAVGAHNSPDRPTARVVGCSTKGVADKLALMMLRDVARPAGIEVEVVSADKLVETARERRGKGEEVLACVAAVSPGGLAQAAGLCRQLRARVPGVRVLVGRWGMTDDKAGAEKFLKDAGAERLAWTLKETVDALKPGAADAGSGNPAAQAPAAG